MSLRVAIQMDPIESIDINGDSTFVMGLEAQKRGYSLFHYLAQDLTMVDGRVIALARPLTLRREKGNHFEVGEAHWIDLKDDVDVVLMRQDPPFDMGYITASHLLDHIHPETFVVNDPMQVRNAPEKLFVTKYPDLMPPTMITRNKQQIEAFRDQHKDIIVKPLFGNGGAGVFHLKPGDENLNSLLEMFEQQYPEPFMIQAYLPDVRKGDKRIILVDGEPVGALNRIPAEGEARSNMHVGGKPAQSELTDREREICARIGQDLKDRDLIFVGIDVIGDYMTEINVTSPTGLQEINRFDGVCLEAKIWDAIEKRLK
ncbi:glutathione synthase [Terasakiella pusilla]|uniref:glutathione synthase n=1 Tax=Terasakiella pusilla TaxID=64973 RepID=UPI00048C1F38|nr:glutathione synthase [Terasakiella pusilla]